VWAVYGLSALLIVYTAEDMSRLPGCLALLAIAALFVWRWKTVDAERDAAKAVRQHLDDGK
jgi:hypothetical protein